MRETAPCR